MTDMAKSATCLPVHTAEIGARNRYINNAYGPLRAIQDVQVVSEQAEGLFFENR